jgi:hypothetical protein
MDSRQSARIAIKTWAMGRGLSLLLTFVLLLATLSGAVPAYAAPIAQGGVQRISFAPGATGATVSGNVSNGQVRRYVLTAMAGQTMTVRPTSDGAPISVTIYDPSRKPMGSVVSGQQWSGKLPATGDYGLAVYPSPYAGYTTYQLSVEVVSGSQPPPPERINFAPGAVSAQVTGYLPPNSSKVYILGARAGQVMAVDSWTSGGPYRYTITAANGNILGSGNQGVRWSGTLPYTGDYRITLESPTDVPATNYGLQITIVNSTPTPVPTPTPAPVHAQRISFPTGATSVNMSGYVDRYTPTLYVLRALRGQSMTVALSTRYGAPTTVTISDVNGNVLGVVNNGSSWWGTLPYTGDYYLNVQGQSGNEGDSYSLWIQIL